MRGNDWPVDGLHLKRPSYQLIDGFRFPMGFPAHALQSARAYVPRADDIFVSTYPKCGTTWVQYIIYLLANGARALPPEQSLGEFFPHLEEVGRDAIEALVEPRLIKTHLPCAMVPISADAKYVYVARNPFDCAVSFYHHTRGFVQHYDFADGSFDAFFECFLAGEVDFGDYFDNLLPWHALHDSENVLFLTYENLREDPAAGIAAIARFMAGRAAALVEDSDRLTGIVEESSFGRMRRDQRRWSSQRPADMPQFVRKGIVGDWRSSFSAEQARRLAAKFDERTRGSGAALLWPQILDAARNS
jgi:hypothetical protein